MKTILSPVNLLTICLLIGSVPMALRAQARVDQDEARKLEEARNLYTSVRDAYTTFTVGTLPRISTSYVSMTVATKRYDASNAVIALAINTNDPGLLANVPAVEINLQPVVFEFSRLPRSVGTPVRVQLSEQRPRFFSTSNTLRELSMAASVPQEANGINVQMTLIGTGGTRGLKFAISLKDEVNAGTAALHSHSFAALNRRSASVPNLNRRFAMAPISFLASMQDEICQEANCIQVSVGCGDCNKSATCNVCDPNDQPQLICSCASSPCSCGIICKGGCPD